MAPHPHPADVAGGGHVVGVDDGNVAVFDARAFVELEARDHERLYQTHVVEHDERPNAHVFSLREGAPDSAVSSSGYGDGSYPVYWGIGAEGELVELVVDFLVLAAWPEEGSAAAEAGGYRN